MQKINLNFNHHRLTIYQRDEADESVVAEIFKFREYRSVEEIIKKAEYPIVDVGAHAGFFTLYARALNPAVKIISLEPEPKNFALLQRHLAKNNIYNTQIIPAALAKETGQRILKLSTDSHNHALEILEGYSSSETNTIPVSALSFSDLRAPYNIRGISLLKMDIEGGEYEILESLTAGDFSKIHAIIMEYHNTLRRSHRSLEEILRKNNFGVRVFPSQFDKNMGFILGVFKGAIPLRLSNI